MSELGSSDRGFILVATKGNQMIIESPIHDHNRTRKEAKEQRSDDLLHSLVSNHWRKPLLVRSLSISEMTPELLGLMRLMRGLGILLFILLECSPSLLRAEQAGYPQLTSLFPLGGQRGTSFEIRVQGENLAGAYGVSFDCESLTGQVKSVGAIDLPGKAKAITEEKPKPKQGHEVVVEVRAERSAEIGAHALRLVTPQGVSGPLVLLVNGEASIIERDNPHDTAAEVQEVEFPGVINGRISKPGEVDYYAFSISKGQELSFEILTGSGLLAAAPGAFRDPETVLYDMSGSWFDPTRYTRLEATDESVFAYSNGQHRLSRVRHRFAEPGRYLARVASLEGLGGPDYTYQLRVVPTEHSRDSESKRWYPHTLAHSDPLAWQEREFSRNIESNRLERLWNRTVQVRPKGDSGVARRDDSALSTSQKATELKESGSESTEVSLFTARLNPVPEKEPNETCGQASAIVIPSILEGAISEPGDVDTFKFGVKAGQKLVFEIETPEASHPYFSPWLEVVGVDGQQLATNLFREVNDNSLTWKKTIQPKTIVSFEKSGEYYFQIRDLTSQRGNSQFKYRILVRYPVPHIGKIVAHARDGVVDRLNVVAGETMKLSVVTEQEEDFGGEVALNIENLPPGVQVLPAATVEDKRLSETVGKFAAIHEERHLPKRLVTSLLLLASRDSPATIRPWTVRLTARPVVDGQPGAAFAVQELPVMVVKLTEAESRKVAEHAEKK
jgi:hypothetical protein